MPRRPCIAALSLALATTLGGQQPAPRPKAAPAPQPAATERPKPLIVSNALGMVIAKGKEGGLEVDQQGRGWVVTSGEAKLKPQDVQRPTAGVDPKLQINRFEPRPDLNVIKLNLTPRDRAPAFLKAVEEADRSKPAALIDAKGRKYQPVGFIYKDPVLTHLRYTRDTPLACFSDAPSVTRNAADRELTLIFAVSAGAQLTEFRIGDAVIERYDPPVNADQPQK